MSCLRISNSLAAPLHLFVECWQVDKCTVGVRTVPCGHYARQNLFACRPQAAGGDGNVITLPLPINIDLVVRFEPRAVSQECESRMVSTFGH